MRLEDYVGLDHFRADEFSEPEKMDLAFMQRLEVARHLAGVSFKITSSQRTDDTPDEIDSTHEVGCAVDISCPEKHHGRQRWAIITGLLDAGFTRIGIYDRHIHADSGERVDATRFPGNVIWWGKSK